ncbi:MAG: lasso RiPP family leader peptide-containing protein [Actinobacteria bacterium]|nr:lasso RiPP family leader peptide-containing protein [Actinomycetota bacterium]
MGNNAPAPYEPPLVEDLGTLEEITGSGVGPGTKEGINPKSG